MEQQSSFYWSTNSAPPATKQQEMSNKRIDFCDDPTKPHVCPCIAAHKSNHHFWIIVFHLQTARAYLSGNLYETQSCVFCIERHQTTSTNSSYSGISGAPFKCAWTLQTHSFTTTYVLCKLLSEYPPHQTTRVFHQTVIRAVIFHWGFLIVICLSDQTAGLTWHAPATLEL